MTTHLYLLRVDAETGDVDGRELTASPELLATLNAAQIAETLNVDNQGSDAESICDAVADVARGFAPDIDAEMPQ